MEKVKKLKKGKKGIKIIVALLVVVAVFLAAGLLLKNLLPGKGKVAEGLTQSYEVTTGSVDSTVSATGNISMDDTTDIVVSTGVIVKEVLVETGDEVKKGDILARLDKTSVVSELIEAKETKEDLEDQLDDDDLSDLEIEKIKGEIDEISDRIKALNKLHENPVIKSTVSGTVAAVNVYAGGEITNTGTGSGTSTDTSQITGSVSGSYTSTADTGYSSNKSATAATASYISLASPLATVSYSSNRTGTSSQLVATTLSTQDQAVADDSGDGNEGSNEDADNKDSDGKDDSGSSEKDSDSSSESGGDSKDQDKEDSKKDDSKKDDSSKDNSKESEEPKVIQDISAVQITAPVTGNKPQTSVSGGEGFSGSISWSPSAAVFAADTSYTATVLLTAKDGYIFRGSYQGGTILNNGKQLKITQTFDKTSSASSTTQNPTGNTKAGAGQTTQSKKATMPSASGSKGASISAASAGSSASDSSKTEFYGTYKAAAFSVSTRKDISIVVSVDELDILSIEKGQTAKVTLDALPDEEIEGTITKISNTGTTTNGNTKYDVEISIPDNEQILDGMSASVVIVTDSAENAVIIPVLALNEKGDKQYVYTSQDSKGNLSGEVEVETGLSDGTNVEITSGLSAGDTIYYQLAGSDDFTNMMNGNMPGGGMNGGPPSGNGGPPSGSGGPPSGFGGGNSGGGK